MGNLLSDLLFSNNDPPDILEVRGSFNRKNAVVLSEKPQVLYFNNQTINKHGNVKVCAGYLEHRKVTITRIKNNEAKKVQQETEFLEKFDCHPNILRYFFKIPGEMFLYTIFECYVSSVEDYFKDKVYLRISEQRVMEDVSKGVNFLNGLRILHLNINPQNVVVACCQDRLIAKLKNFTSSIKLEAQINVRLNEIPGIEGFQAPELIQKRANIKSDIYSMGCLFFYLISNGYKMIQIKLQIQEHTILSRLQIIKQNKSNNILCLDLLIEMLRYDELKRINASLVLDHPYFFTTQQNLILILEAHKLIESKNDTFRTLLFKNSRTVVGKSGDWKDQVDDKVLGILLNIRKAHLLRHGCEANDEQPKGTIINLITQIRNSVSS